MTYFKINSKCSSLKSLRKLLSIYNELMHYLVIERRKNFIFDIWENFFFSYLMLWLTCYCNKIKSSQVSNWNTITTKKDPSIIIVYRYINRTQPNRSGKVCRWCTWKNFFSLLFQEVTVSRLFLLSHARMYVFIWHSKWNNDMQGCVSFYNFLWLNNFVDDSQRKIQQQVNCKTMK